ncbi:MAG: hypothetical protein RL122_2162 [Pseudomonadota bacterium]|jgi:uncharacterized protein YcgL (UPF0745 family)|uniref:YcgL domain-containing protein J1836_010240 n=1 Tax=Thiothrix fructosivorans TaxID=111770 RepID=A0A8B0SP25_9GAMM|nr:YcgL domain-containing protein [Thiothrix fructosivorans]MBO0614187.1 YcgL domain-containing protein [Thiothrix fructosivorans]QTX12669.1 YcgL domain-containing protein [Thiothrix fructosivorans]
MQCYVYRSRRKPGSFLLLPEKDNFAPVPDVLMTIFGTPEFSFDFDLSAERKLVLKVEASELQRVITTNGFFLQLPPSDERVNQDKVC